MKRLCCLLAFAPAALPSDLPSLQDVLQNTGKAVEEFWEQFSAINCTETFLSTSWARKERWSTGGSRASTTSC